jgi:hypothetical protein
VLCPANELRWGIETDIFRELGKVSKPSYRLFTDLLYYIDLLNNVIRYPLGEMTASERANYYRSLKDLLNFEIVQRLKVKITENQAILLFGSTERGNLLLNPYLLKPQQNAHSIQQYWDKDK